MLRTCVSRISVGADLRRLPAEDGLRWYRQVLERCTPLIRPSPVSRAPAQAAMEHRPHPASVRLVEIP